MFTEADRHLLEALSQPMFEGLCTAREVDLKQRLFSSWNNVNSIARVSQQGAILDMEKSFVQGMKASWPEWSGPELPADLFEFVVNSHSHRWLRKKTILIAKMREDNNTLLVMRQASRLGVLTPRQFEVAELYSEGHNTKVIANKLSKEVDTIKNHRKNIYSALDIRSNNELSRLFREAGPLSLNLKN
ncbi:MAG: response regulator transcription factor [Halioglobus sp.]